RIVGRRRHHDGAREPGLAENALDEFLDFATALADQSDDDDVGGGVARHHAEQHALADAAAGKQPDPLAAPDRQQSVDGPHAHVQRLADGPSQQRIDGPAGQTHAGFGLDRSLTIQRSAGAIDNSTEQARPHTYGAGPGEGQHPRIGAHAMQITRGHEIESLAREADHLGLHVRIIGADDLAAIADRRLAALRLERQTYHARQPAGYRQWRHALEAALVA